LILSVFRALNKNIAEAITTIMNKISATMENNSIVKISRCLL
jgi:hypothetical protein